MCNMTNVQPHHYDGKMGEYCALPRKITSVHFRSVENEYSTHFAKALQIIWTTKSTVWILKCKVYIWWLLLKTICRLYFFFPFFFFFFTDSKAFKFMFVAKEQSIKFWKPNNNTKGEMYACWFAGLHTAQHFLHSKTIIQCICFVLFCFCSVLCIKWKYFSLRLRFFSFSGLMNCI